MAVQNLVLISDNARPLEGIVEALREKNPEMTVFRAESLDEFLALSRRLRTEFLVADVTIPSPGLKSEDEEEAAFSPTYGNTRRDLSFLKRYIRRHYDEDLSLKRLSVLTAVTGNYLCAVFKDQEGESLGSFITRVRMEKAALFLIIYPDVQVKDIASRVGYRNLSYFDRVFRNCYGVRPCDYRRKYLDTPWLPSAEDTH